MTSPVHVHVDLFSGIGGFALAAKWAGFDTIAHCENELFCQKVLAKNFPDVPICGDVNEFAEWFVQRFGNRSVDLVTGGFPCQDLSDAGKGAGLSGARSGLWFVMLDVIRRIRPGYVVAENVRGIFSKQGEGDESAIDTVLRGLEQAGYQVGAIVLGADDVGAPHRRKRVFIVGERNDLADSYRLRQSEPEGRFGNFGRWLANGGETGRPLADANGLRRTEGAVPRQSGRFTVADASEESAAGVAELGDACGCRCGGQSRRRAGAQLADGHSEPQKVGVADAGRVAVGSPELRYERHGQNAGRAQTAGFDCDCGYAAVSGGEFEPGMGGAVAGVPDGLDGVTRGWPARPGEEQYEWESPRIVAPRTCPNRSARLKALGNTVVPAQAFIPIMAIRKRIDDVD